MKRGFLTTGKAKKALARDPVVNTGTDNVQQVPSAVVRAVENFDRPEATSLRHSTLPHRPVDDTLSSNSDDYSECLFLGTQVENLILDTPGFPSPVPKSRKTLYRIGPSQYGQGLFATSDIEIGGVVLSERPILLAPASLQLFADAEKWLGACVRRMLPSNRNAYMKLYNCHTTDGTSPLLGRFQTNGFGMVFTEDKAGTCSGIFKLQSRINHSCTPNTKFHFDVASLSTRIRALRPIKAGEEITITYCSVNDYAAQRQAKLNKYGFKCSCTICSDPRKYDDLLARIKANSSESEGSRTVASRQVELKESLRWMDIMESIGWQGLHEYGVHLKRVGNASRDLGKSADYTKYGSKLLLWFEGHKGYLPPGAT